MPDLSHYASGPAEVIATGKDLDVYTASHLRAAVADVTAAGRWNLVIEMTATTFMDATGLAALVGVLRRVRAHDGTLALAGPIPAVCRVLDITGLRRVFAIYDTTEAAITAATETADASA